MHALLRILLVGLAMALAWGGRSAHAQDPGGPLALDEVFDQPYILHQLTEVMTRGLNLGRMGQVEQMEGILRGVVERVPRHPVPHYNLACALARLGKTEEALDALARSVELGMTAHAQIASDPDMNNLRELPRFQEILEQARTASPPSISLPAPVPSRPARGVAKVEESNTGWDPRSALLISQFAFEAEAPRGKKVITKKGPAQDQVRQWYEEGTAAGNHGDLYDNRDRNHSNLEYRHFPLLTRVEYGGGARKRNLDWGTQTFFLYNAITLGNASVAATGSGQWGSMARHAYVNPRTMAILHGQYRRNHLYVYPEHKDHDAGHNGAGGGYGDVFAVNTPYVVISQGSSGSDKVFLEALALTLAAFRPAVKQRLAREGMLMPALQMILRRCNKTTRTAGDYLTGVAHPTVFNGKQLDPMRMVTLAHAITEDALPPLAVVHVVEEDQARPGVDFFHNVPSEVLCTTPMAIGRVARSMRYERRMVVTAEESVDVNGRPLTHHWRVLRGDADRIQINPLNESGSEVELLIPYHKRFPVKPGAKLASNRVDIGAFVHNGVLYSAPAFVSVFYLDNEQRVYDEAGRIQSVQYTGGTTPGNYVDPRIDTPKDWRDDYRYDAEGDLLGWTRTMADGERFDLTPDGRVIARRDAEGKPAETYPAVYPAVASEDGRAILAQATVQPRTLPGPRIENVPGD